ncbi:hypothetical protein J437_LFUL001126 [Ladona fulva]|uniref:Nibrin n=1 Tax=Ladona fulva TaxID=123851 RepID=A0A8K0JX49_LADFU|nr:hypothetical protein J437_LFUL001126 [Ladona fulva]
MLLLTCPNREGSSHRLTADKPHIVSRITGDVILAEDQSVSRKHAVIKERGDSCQVTVTDLGSKYGTYINESTKLEANKPHELKDGDIIKFGCQWNEWRFNSKPLVVTSSTLPTEVKLSLKNLISELGGTLINDWRESCSHLTMESILLTAKVVCALASAVPIVTPEYWTSFKEAIEQKKLPPDPEKFVPPLKEAILNKNKVSFAVNKERKKVFAGKVFVFPTEKQMKKYRTLISAAGGNSITFSDCNWEAEEFCGPDIIIMQNLSDDTQYMQTVEQYNDMLSLLKAKGMRPIPESELGLAILMCSLDIYCNPQYDVSNLLLGRSEVSLSQLKTQEVLAADTPSMMGDVSMKLERSLEENPIKKETFLNVEPFDHKLDSTSKTLEMETIPIEDENNISQLKTANAETEIISGIAPSRKRVAENGSENPSAKKPLLEKDPLDELLSESQCGAFNFIDIRANKFSSKTAGTTQSREDLVDCNKRKQVESVETFPNNPLKKRCVEDYFSTNQANPGSSKDSDNNHAIKGKQSINTVGGSSKTSESFSKEVSSFDRETKTSEMNSKSNGKRDSPILDDPLDVPSTSKGWSNDDQFLKKENKKPKWNRGMAAGILDMVVKMDNLIVERSEPATPPNVSQHKVNFKKFKKARPSTFKNSLPEIIGESDLFCA